MHAPPALDAVFLVYLLVVLPFGALRSAPLLRRPPAEDGDPAPAHFTRTDAMASTLLMLIVTFVFSWLVAAGRDYALFRGSPLDLRGVVVSIGALALAIAVRAAVIRSMDAETLRIAAAWLPRTRREKILGVVTVIAAGVAEEAAFRGVAVVILVDTLGMVWPAVLLTSVAFALAHVAQAWRAVIAVFVFALAMHALVWVTGGLLAAMAVHAIYDILAGYLGMRHRSHPGKP